MQVRIYPFELIVSYKGEIIARHERLFGRDKEHLDPYHYLDLLQRKARAYDQAKVIIDWELPQIYEKYHRRLQVHRESNSKGTREFIDILRLTEDYGIDAIGEILKQLDDKNQYGYEIVLSQLRYHVEGYMSIQPLTDSKLKALQIMGFEVNHMPLSSYDELVYEAGYRE